MCEEFTKHKLKFKQKMTKSSRTNKAKEVRGFVVFTIIAMVCTFMTSCDNKTELVDEYDNLFQLNETYSVTFSIKVNTTRSTVEALEFVEGCNGHGWTITMTHQYTKETVSYSGDEEFNEFSTRVPRGPWSITITIGPNCTDEDIVFSSEKSLIIEDEIYIDHDEKFILKPTAACAAIAWDIKDISKVFYEAPDSSLIQIPCCLVGDGKYGLSFVSINSEEYPDGAFIRLYGLDYRGEYRRIEIDNTKNGYFYPIETSSLTGFEILPEDWEIGGFGLYWKSWF